ncbi:SDR family NAD(P)-dependent oxidoreductase [Actinomadura xylanilytica]|uniref:SDR family NAD(P)-dependent oxidoreductase n=1 Tax=Actinomadura xylanilytica TaxID=887459 RepID=UPI00255AB102|nr:SDR family NAD(P)-dependent oxidoreductase [Actinomadura xylanilytica]MDL4774459.1 SDR family NAD(P)-dependent oxidoreductase [Actinomadura xylanilytica]
MVLTEPSNPRSPVPSAGRVVVVAGASSAAGQAVARRLAAGGTRVVAAARTPREWHDPLIVPAAVDLLDAGATRAWADGVVAEHGRVDGLVHLVGGWRGGASFGDTDLADWAFLHDQLIRTLQHTTLAFHDALRGAPRGRFAIVSQHAAQRPSQNAAAYATAKAAAEAWTLALADSFATRAAGTGPADTGRADTDTGATDTGDTGAAATILVVQALLTDAMRAEKPGAPFTGLTHVDDLAQVVAGLWDKPARELNGVRLDLSRP